MALRLGTINRTIRITFESIGFRASNNESLKHSIPGFIKGWSSLKGVDHELQIVIPSPEDESTRAKPEGGMVPTITSFTRIPFLAFIITLSYNHAGVDILMKYTETLRSE